MVKTTPLKKLKRSCLVRKPLHRKMWYHLKERTQFHPFSMSLICPFPRPFSSVFWLVAHMLGVYISASLVFLLILVLSHHGYIFLTPQQRIRLNNSSASTEGSGCVTLQRRRSVPINNVRIPRLLHNRLRPLLETSNENTSMISSMTSIYFH